MKYKKHPERLFRHLLAAPVIYMMIVPLLILDIFLEIYHRISFPLCGIPTVKRSQYIRIDRQRLKYLNLLDKIDCVYCGYANGLLNYGAAIAHKTEGYWCGIKHKKYKGYTPPGYQANFLKYGDRKTFRTLDKNLHKK